MPPYSSLPEIQDSQVVRNHCADFIYENAPNSVFDKFLEACKTPADETLFESFSELLAFSKAFFPTNDLSNFLSKNIEESINDYEELKSREGDSAYSRFIPVPDNSKRNKSIWMLPNISSFTNIYARINLFMKGNVSGVSIFHDEQVHFDEIISHNKTLVEELDMATVVSFKTANYDFSETASLKFAKSHEYGAIQVADILAGTAMRYMQEKIEGTESRTEIIGAYNGILRMSNPARGLGVNLVTTTNIYRELHY